MGERPKGRTAVMELTAAAAPAGAAVAEPDILPADPNHPGTGDPEAAPPAVRSRVGVARVSERSASSLPAEVVQRIRRNRELGPTLVHAEVVRGTPANWADIPEFLHPHTKALLTARGRERLYSHQTLAMALAHAGRDMLVTTPTASGKSLCYQAPVMDRLLRDPRATAIYIAPTKALARDQWLELQRQAALLPPDAALRPEHIVAYDGDVPLKERDALRRQARVLVTNPDMLHHSILPRHDRDWGRFLPHLSHVVVDEIHYFRGLFGSHVGNVMRRLNRMHAQVAPDARPVQYIGASATLANERELALRLLDRDVAVVNESGAPTADRHVAFLNPSAEGSAAMRSRAVAAYEQVFRASGLQSMIFCRSRRGMEWTLDALRDNACSHGLTRARARQQIQGYRGGYRADQRRDIEGDLRDGRVRTVATTNALEVGIDVGTVGCVVSMGYAGTVASTWQQWGRAGRTGGDGSALAVFLASGDPLDQYIVHNPDFLLNREAEHAHVNPEHPSLLRRHLPCVLSEAGGMRVVAPGPDTSERGRLLWDALQDLRQGGTVARDFHDEHSYSFTGDRRDLSFSIRDIGGSTDILLQEPGESRPTVLGNVETREADALVHQGAVYFHMGARYRVLSLDREENRALVEPDPQGRLITEAIKAGSVSELAEHGVLARETGRAVHGRVRVQSRVTGYRRYELPERRRGRGRGTMPTAFPAEIVDLEDTRAVIYDTSAYWLTVPGIVRADLEREGLWAVPDSAEALGKLLYRLAPLHLMCDPGDLGLHVAQGRGDNEAPATIYIHETFEDGLGLGATLFDLHEDLLARAAAALANCPCDGGCPACVGPTDRSADSTEGMADRKTLVSALLALLRRQ